MTTFRIGDKVRLTEWGVKHSLANPALLLRAGDLPNEFTISKICPMSDSLKKFGSEGVWLSFTECCRTKKHRNHGCIGHPSQHFELISIAKEKVVFT